MLAGSYSTSAANYLQTIFRVQSPCNENGKIKETGYVFDFAPDRTLKMVASAVSVSSKAGKTKTGDAATMGKFLNYCPVIAVSGSEMKEYSATRLLQQLKKAYADKVVKPVGFYYDGNTIVAAPGECCTESFIVLYASNSKSEVENFKSYLFTKTVRFLLLQCVASQDITREKYKFVPHLGTYDIKYTDEILREKWNITSEEWQYIDSRIKDIER